MSTDLRGTTPAATLLSDPPRLCGPPSLSNPPTLSRVLEHHVDPSGSMPAVPDPTVVEVTAPRWTGTGERLDRRWAIAVLAQRGEYAASMAERIRIVVAECSPGDAGPDEPDGGVTASAHGAASVARALRDAGMEVVLAGAGQTPEQVVRAAVDEDADAVAVGAGAVAGAQQDVVGRIVALLAQHDAADVVVFALGRTGGTDAAVTGADPEPPGRVTVLRVDASLDDIVARVRRDVGESSLRTGWPEAGIR